MAICANTDIVAPPITACGTESINAPNFGINPQTNTILAVINKTFLAITFVIDTIPTFCEYVAVGSAPMNAPITLTIPFAFIPPDNSTSVGSRSIPPTVVLVKSPTA